MCTSIVWAKEANGQATLVARNMDWFAQMGSALWVIPAGAERVGLDDSNPLKWTSKYGSTAISSYDIATTDGMNEKGLVTHDLWLSDSTFGPRDLSVPGVSMSMWSQFYLDNFATVAEAVEHTEKNPFQVVAIPTVKGTSKLHLQISDATGDVAVLELVGGKTVIHHGKQYPVLTNQPTFGEQLANLEKFVGFGGKEPLPGSVLPEARFVRASYYLEHLNTPKTIGQAVSYLLSVSRNVAQPYSHSQGPQTPEIAPTIWRTVADSTNLRYMFESTSVPFMIWLDFANLNLSVGAPTMVVQMDKVDDKIAEVSDLLVEKELFDFAVPPVKDETQAG